MSKTESLFRGGVTSPVGIRFPLVIDPNTMVGIYVGTRHEVNFWVNDVSVDGRSLGSMFLRSFTVSQF